MFEEMAIGVKMALTGNPTREIENFTKAIQRATKATESFSEILSVVNKNFIKATEILAKLNPSLKDFNSMISLSKDNTRGLNTTFSTFNRRLDGMSERMTNVTRKASTLAKSMEEVAGATGVASASTKGSFKGLAVAEGGLGGFALGGAAIAGLGAGAMLLHSTYDASKAYQQVLAQIILQNIPGSSAAQINQFIDSQNIPGVSKLDLLQKVQDSLVVSKNINESEGIAPFLAKIGYSNKTLYGGTNQELKEQDFYALVKSSELLTGSMNTDVLKPVIDEMVKINNATSGQVKPTEWLQFLQKTRGSLRGADPKVMYQLEPLIQEYRGSAVGVMVRAFYQHLDAGRLTTAAAMQLDKMGLVKKDHIEYNKIGMLKRILPGGVIDQKLRDSDLVDWYNKYFMSFFKKNHMSLQKEKMINGIIFTNSDLALVNGFAQQQDKIEKTAALNAHAAGTAQMLKQIPGQTASQQAFSAAYENFKKTLGDSTAGSVQGAMNAATKILNFFTWSVKEIDKLLSFTGQVGNMLPSFNDIESAASKVAHKVISNVNANPAPSTIVLQVNQRELGKVMVDHLNQSLYHTQIQQSNNFNMSMTPTHSNTGVPFK